MCLWVAKELQEDLNIIKKYADPETEFPAYKGFITEETKYGDDIILSPFRRSIIPIPDKRNKGLSYIVKVKPQLIRMVRSYSRRMTVNAGLHLCWSPKAALKVEQKIMKVHIKLKNIMFVGMYDQLVVSEYEIRSDFDDIRRKGVIENE